MENEIIVTRIEQTDTDFDNSRIILKIPVVKLDDFDEEYTVFIKEEYGAGELEKKIADKEQEIIDTTIRLQKELEELLKHKHAIEK